MNALGQLATHIMEAAGLIGRLFRLPDDDWTTTAFVVGADGRMAIVGLVDLADAEIARTLEKLIAQRRALLVGAISSVWARDVDPAEPLAELTVQMTEAYGVATDPKHYEMLSVFVTDGRETLAFAARIYRLPGKPPTLGNWHGCAVDNLHGTWSRAVRAAAAAAQERKDGAR